MCLCFLWLGPPWLGFWFSFVLACSGVGREYSSLFIMVINLVFVFSFGALAGLVALCGPAFCVFLYGGGVGTRAGVGWLRRCFSPYPPPPPGGLLLLHCGLFYEAVCFMS